MRNHLCRQRGFTLIELMIVVAIVGIIAAMTYGGLEMLVRRARVNTFLGTLSADISNAHWAAARRGCPLTLVLDADASRVDYSIYRECGSTLIDLDDLNAYPPALPAGTERIEHREETKARLTDVPKAAELHNLAFPFRGVLESLPTGSLGCSFCAVKGTSQRGGLRVFSDGRLAFPGSETSGGAFVFATTVVDGQEHAGALGILAPSGVARVFSF